MPEMALLYLDTGELREGGEESRLELWLTLLSGGARFGDSMSLKVLAILDGGFQGLSSQVDALKHLVLSSTVAVSRRGPC